RALQPELHPVEPRGLRWRAPRHQARPGTRSLLRIAEVRAHDRPAVREDHDRDRPGDLGRRDHRDDRRGLQFRTAAAGQHLPGARAPCRAEEARALAEELLVLAPDHVDALVAVARGRAAAGDAAGALTALQQAQTRAPGCADLHKLQGDVAMKVGDKQGALAAYRAALELDPGYVQVCVDLGRLHEEKVEWSAAQQTYERALDALPTFHEAALALADLLRRSGRARQAVVRLAEMLEQDPYDLPALLLLGRALLDDKRDAQALEAFRRALKFDPEEVEALFQLGVVLARLHRYTEAVEAWEK